MTSGDGTKKKVWTTVILLKRLYEKARSLVNAKSSPTGSINGFFVSAIRAYAKVIKRRQTEAQFVGMSEDTEYQN